MLFSKLKIASAVVFVFVLICGAGILATHAQQEKGKAVPKPVKKNDDKLKDAAEKGGKQDAQAATYFEVWDAYRINDARGDEKFFGKKLSVSGRVLRVVRVGPGEAPTYLLKLNPIPSEEPFWRGFILSEKTALTFVFPADSRKQLAKLEGDQEVTIEAVCQGRMAHLDGVVIFFDCNIVKAK